MPKIALQCLRDSGDWSMCRRSAARAKWTHAATCVVLPPQTDNRTDAAELSTRIIEPGLTLRLEHDDPVRRDGDYRAQRDGMPMPSRLAATRLEFAIHEAARVLDWGASSKQKSSA